MSYNKVTNLNTSEINAIEEWLKQNERLYYYYYLKVKLENKGIIEENEELELNRRIYKARVSINKAREVLFADLSDIEDEELRNETTTDKMCLIMLYIGCKYKPEEIAESKIRYTINDLRNKTNPVFKIFALLQITLESIKKLNTFPDYSEKTNTSFRMQYAIIEILESSGVISRELAEVSKWTMSTIFQELEQEIYDNNCSTHIPIEMLLDRDKSIPGKSNNPVVDTMLATAKIGQIMYNYNQYTEIERLNELTTLIIYFSTMPQREYLRYKEDTEEEKKSGMIEEGFLKVLDIVFLAADSIREGKTSEGLKDVKIKTKAIEL